MQLRTSLLAVAAALAGCNLEVQDEPPSAADRCAALARSAPPNTTLTATYNADKASTVAGTALVAHCLVDGKTNERTGVDGKSYAIGFRLRLPDDWNGRLVFMGGGGNDGSLGNATGPNVGTPPTGMLPALQQGWAVVSTDGGHTGGSADFAVDPQARIDHAYNAFDKTTVNAKALIASRYGRAPDKNYFQGCSGGGRQGMMFTQRFPSYFDGVIVHAPAMRVSSGATIAAMWNHIKLTAAAPVENGNAILSKAFSNSDLALVSSRILQQCDAADGLADGMVNHIQACSFDPAVLQCPGAKDNTCLSAAQVTALKAVFDGPRNSAGTRLYAGQPADPGIDQGGWRSWTLGSSTTATPNSAYVTLMSDALRWEFFWPSDPTFNILNFNFDIDPLRMAAESSIYDTYRDDSLAPYKARGGKLMMLHGMADPIFNMNDSIDYYQRLAANNGGIAATQAFARLYAIPGENHCAGGRATDQFDALSAMVDWVEKGTAPDRLLAAAATTHPIMPGRTRPLCPFPKYARYNGTGAVEQAASFTCTDP
jgi:feruloyl esterase